MPMENFDNSTSLLESEDRYRQLVELCPDLIAINYDGKIAFINSAGATLLGAESPDQLIGRSVKDFIHTQNYELSRQRLQQLRQSKSVPSIEETFIRLDGTVFYAEASAMPITYYGKRAILVVAHDITERKHLELSLKENEEQFRAITESAPEGIVIVDNDGNILSWSNGARKIFGYTAEEIIGRPASDLLPAGHYRQSHEHGMEDLHETGHYGKMGKVFESVGLRKDGTSFPLEISMSPYETSRKIYYYAVIIRDVTGRKQTEEELRRHRDHLDELVKEKTAELTATNQQLQQQIIECTHMAQSLRNSEEQYRMLVQSANSIILRMDKNGVVKFFNEFALNYFGFQEEEILGRSVVGTIVPKTDTLGLDLEAMIRDITKHPDHYAMNENENMLRSGERVWIAWTNKAIVDKERNVTEILCIGTDITRSKLAEQRLLNYQKQLQSLASELSLAEERERRRIAVDLHDRIAQSMGLARIKIEELSKSGHCANAGQSIAEIRELLDQTIQATRSLTFELCPPVLYELGFETALEWQMEEIRKLYGLTINFENSMNAAPLDDDMRVILFQATRELLVNVAKHAGAKSARVCVEKNGRCIRINVEDDGVGFDMAEAERRVGKNGGFGLFSIRERLKYLGGSLECDSQQGCGTRISLVAPLKKS